MIYQEHTSPAEVIRGVAQSSYQLEKTLYSRMNLENFPEDAQSLKDYLIKGNNFRDFQEALQLVIYGEAYVFVKYFYDIRFIRQIAVNSSSLSKAIKSNTSSKGKAEAYNAYLDLQSTMKGALLPSEVLPNGTLNLDTTIKKASESILNFLINLDVFDKEHSSILQAITQDAEEDVEKDLEKVIEEYLYNNAFFAFGYADPTGAKRRISYKFITEEEGKKKRHTTILNCKVTKSNKINGKASSVLLGSNNYPVLSIKQIQKILNQDDYRGLIFQLYADQSVLRPILSDIITLIQSKYGDEGLVLVDQTNNSFKTAFLENKLSITQDAPITQEYSKVFLDTIYRLLGNIEPEAASAFEEWRGKNNVDSYLFKMIKEDPHILNEIIKQNYAAGVSGTIGEVIFSLLLRIAQSNSETKTTVKILGQTDFGTGSAAVDVKLMSAGLRDIGFQIKNYSSIKNTISLYGQSNKLSAEKEMSRYIEDSAYKVLQQIFFTEHSNTNPLGVYYNENYETSIKMTNNILNQHIPYYLRFDEASIQKQNQDLAQNNFYIINFSFIPASIIFIFVAESLEEIDIKRKDFFYFSDNKQEGDILHNNYGNLLSSWEQTYKNLSQKNNNMLQNFKDNLYINFLGARITFKNKLDIIFDKTSKVR